MRPIRRVLLVDPSQKGALPLYTGMIAEGLSAIGLEPIVLANTDVVDSGLGGSWSVMRRLRAGPWPPPPGARPQSAINQFFQWIDLALTVWRTAWEVRPDIIHIQHPLHPRLDPFLLTSLRLLSPVAWTAHDILPHDGGANERVRAKRIYQHCDLVLVHNTPAQDQVKQIAEVYANVIHHPVRALKHLPSREQARAELGLDADLKVFSAVGFIRSYKGYQLLSDALALCSEPDVRLIILGELVDESQTPVINAIRSDARSVIRLGYAREEDLIRVIAASDAVLLPHEAGSDSGSLHMARALGTPVIAANTPQLSAVVTESRAGIVLPRDPHAWASAMQASPPPPPPPPPSPSSVGREHLQIYRLIKRTTRP